MQVIFGEEQKELLSDRFTILELDTFKESNMDEPITAYAVISADNINLDDVTLLDNLMRLHNTMMLEYRKRNWDYCHQALEHLKGKWNKDLDSFYDAFHSRIQELEKSKLPDSWDGIVYK